MAVDATHLLKVYRQLRSQRSPFEAEWRDCATYIQPRKSSAIGTKPTVGEKQTRKLYDSTAIHANGNLANTMHGTLTSPAIRWFKYQMRTQELNQDVDVKDWLDVCAGRVYAALGQSNWNAENLEVFLDLGAFGTGGVFLTEREPATGPFQGLQFRSLPIGTYVISEDAEGKVDTVIYDFSLAAEAVVRRFGEPNVGDRIARLAKEKPTERVDLLHAVMPRLGGTYGSPAGEKPWASCYLSERDKHILEEGGYDLFPFAVPRWAKASGESYGRGPGHTALPDIQTLNAMTRMELEQIALAIKPPLGARDHGVIGAIRWVPGGVTTIREKDSLIPFESGAKFQVGQIKSAELKSAIKDMFYNNQLQLPTNQPMTATEIERRYELMNRVLGPTVGRIEFEHTNVVAMRAFALMMLRGALPAPPPIIEEAALSGNDHLDVVSEGPLARAQKGSEVLAIERSLQIILPMAEASPQVLDVMKMDEAAKVVMEASNVPARVFASQVEIDQVRQVRAQAQQQEQQMQTLERAAAGAKNIAPILQAVKPTGGAAPAPPAAA
jgi:Bacteriophage head to tail connecting protein